LANRKIAVISGNRYKYIDKSLFKIIPDKINQLF